MLEKMFKFKENNTNVKTEVIAGLTTFMTMAYILAVNPNLLSAAGMDPTAVLIATYKIHPVWWTFIDIFFFFIMAFCHAMSCLFAKINPAASRRLDIISLVCGCAGIIAFLVEYILLNCMN